MSDESPCLWAVLASPVSEAEARAQYQAVAGREPDRMHKHYYALGHHRFWWLMGWLTPSEARAWRRASTSYVLEIAQDGIICTQDVTTVGVPC